MSKEYNLGQEGAAPQLQDNYVFKEASKGAVPATGQQMFRTVTACAVHLYTVVGPTNHLYMTFKKELVDQYDKFQPLVETYEASQCTLKWCVGFSYAATRTGMPWSVPCRARSVHLTSVDYITTSSTSSGTVPVSPLNIWPRRQKIKEGEIREEGLATAPGEEHLLRPQPNQSLRSKNLSDSATVPSVR